MYYRFILCVVIKYDAYFRSARSLAGSDNSVQSSYIKQQAKSGPPALYLDTDSSSEDENVQPPRHPTTMPRPIPRSVSVSSGQKRPFLPR